MKILTLDKYFSGGSICILVIEEEYNLINKIVMRG